MMKLAKISAKIVAGVLLFAVFVTVLSEFSPIYDFGKPVPFSGPDIFNPYASFDSLSGWKRANFHTHTKVDGPLNECPEYPDVVYEDYSKLGYGILTFSNHNELTVHPFDSTLQVNVYEHGINLFKFHKLVFNPDRMILHDPLLPILVSQKQWEYDYLSGHADFIFMNHPDRTWTMSERTMQALTGYRFIEADSGIDTELRRWDEALSAGHYSFNVCDDDCHDSGNHARIGIRCSWLNSPSACYEDIRRTLLSGCFYSMRVPDYGNGDWDVKYGMNATLPAVEAAGAVGDSIFVKVSREAEWIKVTGQDHRTLDSLSCSSSMSYRFGEDDSYARFTVSFGDGLYLYTNPFARYDKKTAPSPYRVAEHVINWPLSLLFNLFLLGIAALCITAFIRLFPHKEHKS